MTGWPPLTPCRSRASTSPTGRATSTGARSRAAGVSFAYIKATEGGDHLDPKFLDNWYAAKRAGIARGAYHFVYWCRPANEQALWFMLNVPPDSDALPPVLDVEWNSRSKTCPGKVDRDTALQKIKIMLDAMEAHTGKRPIIYTDPKFHREVLEGEFTNYHFWLRSVAAEPEDIYRERGWSFWQFTTTGKVPGVDGKVDRNSYNGTLRGLGSRAEMAPGRPLGFGASRLVIGKNAETLQIDQHGAFEDLVGTHRHLARLKIALREQRGDAVGDRPDMQAHQLDRRPLMLGQLPA